MTEHIMNFAIGIDDDAIIRNVQEKAERQIIKDIELEILNKIFTSKYYGEKAARINRETDMPSVNTNATFSYYAEQLIDKAIGDVKEEIIERASDKLVESYKRTKAWKEKTNEVLGEK